MKNSYIEYIPDWKSNPMSYWVHIEKDGQPWFQSKEFDPPAPKRFGEIGYAQLTIEFDGCSFMFTSAEQLQVFIEIMECKLLPSSLKLSGKRDGLKGPNSHWISRLPSKTKNWKYRKKLITYCKSIKFPR